MGTRILSRYEDALVQDCLAAMRNEGICTRANHSEILLKTIQLSTRFVQRGRERWEMGYYDGCFTYQYWLVDSVN